MHDQIKEIETLKKESTKFHEEMSNKINQLCNSLYFRDASKLSIIGDKLDRLVIDIQEFYPKI